MLYAKEDRINNKLMFACRTCQYSEEAVSACVFRNSIYNIIGETAGVTQDVGSDPTVCLPDVYCLLCGQVITCNFCDISSEDGVEAVESSDHDDGEAKDDYGEEDDSLTSVEEAPEEQKSHDAEQHGGGKRSRTSC